MNRPLGRAVALGLALVPCHVQAEASWFRERFLDPEDGAFDMSNFILDHHGALAVPIVITEPAVGYGGGLALAWFSESIRTAAARAKEQGTRVAPPDIMGVAAFATENGTKGGGLGGRFSFRDDTIRYRGGGGYTSVNLDFYGAGGGLAPQLDKIGYNLTGYAIFNEVTMRLGESDQFLGLRQLYMDLDSKLDFGTAADTGLQARSFTQKNSALGITYVYDSRDNIFTTRKGVEASIDGMFYSPSLGGDATFQAYRGHVFAYVPAREDLTVALRADARTARGDVPFYQYPFLDLRGVPAMRYQDENTAIVEAEVRYWFTPRWIGVAFMGAGRAWGLHSAFPDEATVVNKGVGVRYVLARRLGLSAGIDVARGPESTSWYIQVGNAWR